MHSVIPVKTFYPRQQYESQLRAVALVTSALRMNPMWKNSAQLRCAKQRVLCLDVDLWEFVAAGPSGAGAKNCSTLQVRSTLGVCWFLELEGKGFTHTTYIVLHVRT